MSLRKKVTYKSQIWVTEKVQVIEMSHRNESQKKVTNQPKKCQKRVTETGHSNETQEGARK